MKSSEITEQEWNEFLKFLKEHRSNKKRRLERFHKSFIYKIYIKIKVFIKKHNKYIIL